MATEDIINYVEVNGVHIPEGELTPTNYFDFVKAGKKEITDEDLQGIADKCLKMLEGTIVTEQKTMAEKILFEVVDRATGERKMWTEDKRYIPDKARCIALRTAGYKVLLNGKVYSSKA